MRTDLNFEMDVLNNAQYEANPQEFFTRAYLSSDVADNFRALPSIKTKTKMAFTIFHALLQDANCEFTSSNQVLGAIDIEVKTLAVMIQLCQFELEQSFIVQQMAKGANGNWEVAEFFSYFWNEAAMEVAEEVEMIRWRGDTAGTFDSDESFLVKVDGYEKKLEASTTGVTATLNGTIDASAATLEVVVNKKRQIEAINVLTPGDYSVAPTTVTLAGVGEGTGATFTIQTGGSGSNITVTGITVVTGGDGYPNKVVKVSGTTLALNNILAEMAKVFTAQPKQIRRRKDLLRWHMSPIAADLYRLATAAGNTQAYITKSLDLTYLDIKIVVNDGMSDNAMCLTRKDNLIYAFDGEGDGKALKIINMSETTAEPILRARTQVRLGFYLINENEIVWYKD